eukprot:1660476-Rhodomonas_salina.1
MSEARQRDREERRLSRAFVLPSLLPNSISDVCGLLMAVWGCARDPSAGRRAGAAEQVPERGEAGRDRLRPRAASLRGAREGCAPRQRARSLARDYHRGATPTTHHDATTIVGRPACVFWLAMACWH